MNVASSPPGPKQVSRSLANLSIRQRLYIGFGVLILSGVALAGFAITQMRAIGGDVGRSVLFTTNTDRVDEIVRRSALAQLADTAAAAEVAK